MPTALRCLWLLPLLSSIAVAVPKGGPLYIRAGGAPLLKEPKEKAVTLTTLTAGEEVAWMGVSEKDNRFHEVVARGKKGFVERGDLVPHKPQVELTAPAPEPGFAQSGAANKDAPPPGSPEQQAAEARLRALEAFNQQVATPAAVEAKRRALHPK